MQSPRLTQEGSFGSLVAVRDGSEDVHDDPVSAVREQQPVNMWRFDQSRSSTRADVFCKENSRSVVVTNVQDGSCRGRSLWEIHYNRQFSGFDFRFSKERQMSPRCLELPIFSMFAAFVDTSRWQRFGSFW